MLPELWSDIRYRVLARHAGSRRARQVVAQRLLSMLQRHVPPPGFWLAARVAGDPANAVGRIRDALLAAHRNLPLDITPLNDLVRASVADDQLTMRVTARRAALIAPLDALRIE